MKKESNADINLLQNEEILFKSHSIENSSITLIYFPLIWMMVAFFSFIGILYSYSSNNFFFFYLTLLFLITFSIFWGFLWDSVLRASKALLIITSKRVFFMNGRGLLRYEKKRKEINIDEIAYMQIFPDSSIEIAKRNLEGDNKYNGTEKKYRLTLMKYYSISFSLNGPEGVKIKDKIIEILSGITGFSKHPNLEGLLLRD